MLLTLLFLVALLAFASLLTHHVESRRTIPVQANAMGSSGHFYVTCGTTSVFEILTLTRLLRFAAACDPRSELALKNFCLRFAFATGRQEFNAVAYRLDGSSTFPEAHIAAGLDVDQLLRSELRFRASPNCSPHVLARWQCQAGVRNAIGLCLIWWRSIS